MNCIMSRKREDLKTNLDATIQPYQSQKKRKKERRREINHYGNAKPNQQTIVTYLSTYCSSKKRWRDFKWPSLHSSLQNEKVRKRRKRKYDPNNFFHIILTKKRNNIEETIQKQKHTGIHCVIDFLLHVSSCPAWLSAFGAIER